MAVLTWMRSGVTPLAVEQGVLRAAECQQLAHMTELVEDARRHAQLILDEAHDAAASLQFEAKREAESLLRVARAEITELQQSVREETECRAVTDWYERQSASAVLHAARRAAMHEQLADVVTTAVQRIIDSEDRAAIFRRALDLVGQLTADMHQAKLRVHVDDLHTAQVCAKLATAKDPSLSVTVVADSSLLPGSCLFESNSGLLDAIRHGWTQYRIAIPGTGQLRQRLRQ